MKTGLAERLDTVALSRLFDLPPTSVTRWLRIGEMGTSTDRISNAHPRFREQA